MTRGEAKFAMGAIGWAVFVVLLFAVLLLGEGCMTSSVSVTFTDANAMVGFVRMEGDAIAPGFGSESGPRLAAKLAKDQRAAAEIKGYATLSNTVEFAGIYASTENKYLEMEAKLSNAPTNATAEAVR